MITRVETLNFRSLRWIEQDVSPFQVLVGPNASGKSALLDVVNFLGDLLRVGPYKAIVGDVRSNIPSRAADPSHLCWMRQGARFELAIELKIPEERAAKLPDARYQRARYEVAIHTGIDGGEAGLSAETLWLAPSRAPGNGDPTSQQRVLFPEHREPPLTIVSEPNRRTPTGWRKVVNKIEESGNDYFLAETSGWNNPFRLGPAKSSLANLPEDESRFPVATWVKKVLMEGVERVALNAEAMRTPSPPGAPRRFRPDGSNLPWVIEGLRSRSPERFDRWVERCLISGVLVRSNAPRIGIDILLLNTRAASRLHLGSSRTGLCDCWH